MNRSTTTLLRGLILPGESAREYLDGWCRGVDLDAVDSATHPLLPLLFKRLEGLGMSPPEMARLGGVYRKTWYRNQRHLAALRSATEVLLGTGAEPTVVGGLALALGPYQDLGVRMVDAGEIVVLPSRIDTALQRLTDSGFVIDGRARVTGFGLPNRLTHPGGGQIDVRDFVLGPGWMGAPDEQMWSRRVPGQLEGVAIDTLAPDDAVVAALTSGLTTPRTTYQWIVDVAVLVKHATPAIEWRHVIRDYEGTVLSVPIYEALTLIDAALAGALIPETATLIGEMNATRRHRTQFWSHRRGRRFARLPGWYRRGLRSPGKPPSMGFSAFVKSVYDVADMREALTKALARVRRG